MVERLNNLGETSVTVKSVFLIAILCAVLGAGFTMMTNHEMRISRVEAFVEDAKLTKKVVMAIREDQVAFYRSQNRQWKSSFDMKGEIFK